MNRNARTWKATWKAALLVFVAFGVTAVAQQPERKGVAVRHPNLLFDQKEIEQVKLKIREHAWAARLLDRVKAKAEQDGAAVETALAYAVTGEDRYARSVRDRLVEEVRDQMPRYEKLDVKAEPEWGRWSWWGATAWAYDLAYDAFTPGERAEIERWLRTGARTIIAQEKVLTTTPNLVFDEHWRVGMIGYCLGDAELIDWALHDPGRHGASRGGFYPVMDSMIQDGHFWGEAPIYALRYDVHGMFALAEAALRYDGTDLHRYESPKSGASLKKLVDGYLRMTFPLERNGSGGESFGWPPSATGRRVASSAAGCTTRSWTTASWTSSRSLTSGTATRGTPGSCRWTPTAGPTSATAGPRSVTSRSPTANRCRRSPRRPRHRAACTRTWGSL
jgi:hypothetical protein